MSPLHLKENKRIDSNLTESDTRPAAIKTRTKEKLALITPREIKKIYILCIGEMLFPSLRPRFCI